ncbi:MAG: cation transporting ATPase C-terminal domain-containing protein [Candidatus Bathyarchaeales archaeon]
MKKERARPHKFLLLAVLWEASLMLILLSIPITRQALGIVEVSLFEFALVTGLCLVTLFVIEITKFFLYPKENKDAITNRKQ